MLGLTGQAAYIQEREVGFFFFENQSNTPRTRSLGLVRHHAYPRPFAPRPHHQAVDQTQQQGRTSRFQTRLQSLHGIKFSISAAYLEDHLETITEIGSSPATLVEPR